MENLNEQQEYDEQAFQLEKLGLNYVIKLSYSIIDKSDYSLEEKRNLLFSVYSFRCLFNNEEMLYANPVLLKYGCTFLIDIEKHPQYKEHLVEFNEYKNLESSVILPYNGIMITHENKRKIRFDAGSPLFEHFVKTKLLSEINATIPNKYSLYEMVLRIVGAKNATSEIKAMWYFLFPYIMLIGADHEKDIFNKLQELLFCDDVFNAFLNSRFSLECYDSVEELQAVYGSSLVCNWYKPYLEYKDHKNNKGLSREVIRFNSWLNSGRILEVFNGSEKLLNTFPFDENLRLTNLSARVSLPKTENALEKENLLKETLSIIEDYLSEPLEKKEFFIYYKGLSFLGLQQIEPATDCFIECNEINPNFEPAKVMLKALQEKFIKSLKGNDVLN